MGNGEWGRGQGAGRQERQGRQGRQGEPVRSVARLEASGVDNYQLPIPNAQCPMPNCRISFQYYLGGL
ncbi:MAG: hypothetical protein KME31_10420 [Tolypothrix carrinoi HA7290-LM1]|nr:hypothetical protein [Tolypothrix carrinoi HA7290-LM1]